MEEINEIVPSIEKFFAFKNFALGTGAATTILSTIFVIRRIGLSRALALAIHSRFKSPEVISQRSVDVKLIKEKINGVLNRRHDVFLIVNGPKGVGRTAAVETALQRTYGVCWVYGSIQPGMDKDRIVSRVLGALTKNQLNWIKEQETARRVIFWHRFYRKPVVVLSAQACRPGQQYAQITEAARDLAIMGLRIVIDCPDGALPEESLTKRELIHEMQPMNLEEINRIPELNRLIQYLKNREMYDVIVATCGGEVILWFELNEFWLDAENQKTSE